MQVGFTLKQFKGLFFDKALVEGKIDRATYVVMSRFGAMVRQTARRGFRRRTAKQIVPGKPPRNLTDKLRGAILFGWDPRTRSEVVGPWLFPKQKQDQPAPKMLEHGGETNRTVNIRRASGMRREMVRYRFRQFPYMMPALVKESPNLPGLWRNTIR